jgi:hypothetical protein
MVADRRRNRASPDGAEDRVFEVARRLAREFERGLFLLVFENPALDVGAAGRLTIEVRGRQDVDRWRGPGQGRRDRERGEDHRPVPTRQTEASG